MPNSALQLRAVDGAARLDGRRERTSIRRRWGAPLKPRMVSAARTLFGAP
jgi:hypothetical protein